jgi:hypothetical protein
VCHFVVAVSHGYTEVRNSEKEERTRGKGTVGKFLSLVLLKK